MKGNDACLIVKAEMKNESQSSQPTYTMKKTRNLLSGQGSISCFSTTASRLHEPDTYGSSNTNGLSKGRFDRSSPLCAGTDSRMAREAVV